jgi:hypothetical protein
VRGALCGEVLSGSYLYPCWFLRPPPAALGVRRGPERAGSTRKGKGWEGNEVMVDGWWLALHGRLVACG